MATKYGITVALMPSGMRQMCQALSGTSPAGPDASSQECLPVELGLNLPPVLC